MLSAHVRKLVSLALEEDIGRGDLTSRLTLDESLAATAWVLVKEPCRLAGLELIEAVFAEIDPSVSVERLAQDGQDVTERRAVCKLTGKAWSILAGERTALNFLGRMTGVATTAREAAARLAGSRARLLDTRKTTPGWRELEKYAVAVGGAKNHRFALDDMILIKDNHIALAGGIEPAIERVLARAPLFAKVEVEVDTLVQLREALRHRVDMILLDNMDLAQLKQAVEFVQGRVPLEASGNMSLDRLADVAGTGVDYISMGALTHAVHSIDVGLDIVQGDVDTAQGDGEATGE